MRLICWNGCASFRYVDTVVEMLVDRRIRGIRGLELQKPLSRPVGYQLSEHGREQEGPRKKLVMALIR